MSPARITLTIKVDQPDLPAETITIELPHMAVARYVLRLSRSELNPHNSRMTTSVLNALTALSPISADAKEKKLAQRARAERLYQETGDALNKVVDFLDRTLARIEVA